MLVSIEPDRPDPRTIRRAVQALEAGEVIAYPTDTVYGLGCDLFNKKALDRLYQIKGMPRTQQLSFICPDLSNVAHYAIVENATYRLLRRLLPGPYTLLLTATREVPRLVQSKKKTVGLRVPKNEVVLSLARELGRPIVNTTAKPPGGEAMVDPDEIDDQFHGLALVLDAGAGGTVPTTVIDLTGPEPIVVREGAGAVDMFGPSAKPPAAEPEGKRAGRHHARLAGARGEPRAAPTLARAGRRPAALVLTPPRARRRL
jgi:tRNA threonylcarbamoyl adenosine modification protein (Sua5/YciO/YrdC/YwlC family)